tara:strand:+ start:5855 stop:6052 length:198 start_codon:yes stop_codon:yes gene_type:complete
MYSHPDMLHNPSGQLTRQGPDDMWSIRLEMQSVSQIRPRMEHMLFHPLGATDWLFYQPDKMNIVH